MHGRHRRLLPLLLAGLFLSSTFASAGSGPAVEAAPDVPPADAFLAPLSDTPEAIAETLRLPAATWYNDRDGDRIFDSLEQRFLEAPLSLQPVIVTFRHGTDVTDAMDTVQAAAGPLDPRYVYEHVGGFAADLSLHQVLAIAGLDAVRQVEWSQPGAPELDTATATFGVDAVQERGILGDRDGLPASITGEDVVIAIMDTGFDGDHVDLQGKFLRFIDWSADGEETEPYDSGNHGTHVASIAGGLGKGDPAYTGVAPGAAFVGFLISSSDTKGAAIASVDWMLEHRNETRVDISTISFGFGTTVDGTDALELAMDRAWEAGIVPFKSCGNSGPETGTVTIPGGARGILCTGSMFDAGEGGFRLSSFSSRGPTADGRVKPDIAAPGSSIMAAEAGSGDGYVSLSGTSMASPFAAGTAALMLSADPELSNEDVRRILAATAQDWGPGAKDVDYGAGRIDAVQAVQQVLLERALREGWAYGALAPYAGMAPVLAGHLHGVLEGSSMDTDAVTASFEVEDAGTPLAITVIHNGSASGLPALQRAIAVQVVGPDDAVLGSVSQAPDSRQQTFSVTPTSTGTHTLEARGLLGDERLFYDLNGAVAGSAALTDRIPDETAYAAMAGAGPDGDAQATPIGWLLAFVAIGAALLVRRGRR